MASSADFHWGSCPTATPHADRTCQIVVGTPGRICGLVEAGRMPLETVSILVLDEADQLLGESFAEDISWLRSQLERDGLQVTFLMEHFRPRDSC